MSESIERSDKMTSTATVKRCWYFAPGEDETHAVGMSGMKEVN